MKFIASFLMAALFSHANSTELIAEQVNQAFGTGPILMQPTAQDPLSYHGTFDNTDGHTQLHQFWEYPATSYLPNEHKWDTKDANRFCTSNSFVKNGWGGIEQYQCKGHKAVDATAEKTAADAKAEAFAKAAAEKQAADAKAAADEAAKKAIKTMSSTPKSTGNWYKTAKGSLVGKGKLPASK